MQSNAPLVLTAAMRRSVLLVVAAGIGALLPFLMDSTPTFDWRLAIKAVLAAMILSFFARMAEGGMDAYRASNGIVNRGDVAANLPAIGPPPGTATAPFALQRPDPDEGYTQSYRPVRAPLGTPPTRPQDPQR